MAFDPFKAVALALQTPGAYGQAGLPVILWGPPGIGKTGRIRKIFEALARRQPGLILETVIAGLREPSDFAGLPKITSNGVELVPPAWARRLAAAPRGVGFLDELSTASPATQKALLRVVLEGVVGDLALPPTVSWVAAANAVEHAADGYDLAPATANRFIHLEVERPSATEWAAWLMSAGGEAEADVPILDQALWADRYREVRALAAAYLQRFPGQLLDAPVDEARAGRAWPSPRSWELGLRGYAAGLVVGDELLAGGLLAGAVGPGVAAQFVVWVREQDLPDPREVLAHARSWTPDKRRLDRALATLSACAAVALESGAEGAERAALVEAAWLLVGRAVDLKVGDLALPAGIALVKAAGGAERARGPEEARALVKLLPLLKAGGILAS
jgi:hypothetical protein